MSSSRRSMASRTLRPLCMLGAALVAATWCAPGRVWTLGAARPVPSTLAQEPGLQAAGVRAGQGEVRGSEARHGQPFVSEGKGRRDHWAATIVLALVVLLGAAQGVEAKQSTDMSAVAPCLLQNCQVQLAQCLTSPNCAANLTCILGCQSQPDPSGCEIKCGDLFENGTVDIFNACALKPGAKRCVPQRADTGEYPVPPPGSVTESFEPKLFDGRWYISAGLNPLFDTFDCQVHFFAVQPADLAAGIPERLVANISYRVVEPDGEFFTRSVVQTFKTAPGQPGLLLNHDNDFLHYEDDWYILDHGDEGSDNGFILVYYRGRNDAWDGYGGAVLYTRSSTVLPSIVPRVQEACKRAGLDWDKFQITNNTCKTGQDVIKLREQFAEQQLEKVELKGVLTAQELLTQARRYAERPVAEAGLALGGGSALERVTVSALDFERELQKELQELKDDPSTFQELGREVLSRLSAIYKRISSAIPSL